MIFRIPDVPRAYPYGIYDLGRNAGFVNVGTDHDTAAFAVASIRGWWRRRAAGCIRDAAVADHRGWWWQQWLAAAAVEVGIAAVGRPDRSDARGLSFSAGTSKWNKVEHRLFSFISFQLARRAA